MLSLLRTDAALRALEPEWVALWQRAGRPPFQAPAWLLPWWDRFGTGEPCAAVARDPPGRLVGLLPLYLLDEGRARKLLPLGVGLSDHFDALLDPAAPRGIAARLFAAALEAGAEAGATECWLPDLPPSALRDAPAPPGWDEGTAGPSPCPVLRLGADLRATIPAAMLRDVRQARHRADRLGGWTASLAADPAARWPAFADLHAARWRDRGDPLDAAALAFHEAAVPRLAAAGMLRLYELRIAGRLAAAYYTLATRDGLAFYLSAFEAGFARASPGTLLLAHVAEQAIAEGLRELDFLRGGEAYKFAWGAVDRPNVSRALRPNAVGLALAGRLAPGAALARMALAGRDAAAAIDAAGDHPRARSLRLLEPRAKRVGPMLREAGRQHRPGASVASVAALFDRAVVQSPEASVAAWSLGDPETLAEATDELVDWLLRERLVWPGARVLDLGCGIGRVAAALAARGARVLGLDVSPAMVAEARRRAPRVRFERTDGRGLPRLAEARRDLLLAVDSFPYLVQAGVAEAHVADAARVLRPGGALVILNLSYRDDPSADRADAERWARTHGLRQTFAGEQPFASWDGTAWVFRRPEAPA